jgi:hypothetical protein
MTTSTTARRSIERAPILVGLVAVAAYAAGLATTAIATAGAHGNAAIGPSGAAPAPTFDAVKFRAEERAGSYPEPTFDAVKFRAEEAGR